MIREVHEDYPNLVKHQNGIIYFRMYKKGKGQTERSTGESSWLKAKNKIPEIMAEWMGTKRKKSSPRIFGDLWPVYFASIRGRRKSTDEREHQIGEQWFLPFFGDDYIHQIEEHWEPYIEHCQKKGITLFSHRKSMIRFFRWAVKREHMERVPDLRNPDPQSKAGRVYSKDEITRMLEKSLAFGYTDLHLHILMSITMGTRASENCALPWDQVDLTKGTITLTADQTKTKKGRTFAIPTLVQEILEARLKLTPSRWLFPMPSDSSRHHKKDYFNKGWARVKKEAKIVGRARFHDLRHTLLTHAFKKPINPMLICNYAGLDIRVAQRVYLHFTAEDTQHAANPLGLN